VKWLGTDHWLLPDGRHLLLCKARVLGVGPGTFADFTGSTEDGRIYGYSTAYATARSTAYGIQTSSTTLYVGQDITGGVLYTVYRAYLAFDTSAIPDGDTVTDVKLYMKVAGDASSTDFEIEVYRFDWDSPITSDNKEANYDAAGASLDQVWRNTSDGVSAGQWYYNATSLDTDWIAKTGTTRYMLKSSRDTDGNTPSGSEYITVCSAEESGSEPYLAITYVNSISTTQQFQWEVRNEDSDTQEFTWALRNAVSDTQEFTWALRNAISDAQQFQWTLGNSLVKDQQLQWTLYNLVSDAQQFQWGLRTEVANAQALAYAIRNATSKAQQFQWDIGSAVSKAQTLSWLVGGVIAQYQQFQWDLTLPLAKVQILRWALSPQLSTVVLGMPDVAIGLDLPDRTPVLGMPDVAIEVEME